MIQITGNINSGRHSKCLRQLCPAIIIITLFSIQCSRNPEPADLSETVDTGIVLFPAPAPAFNVFKSGPDTILVTFSDMSTIDVLCLNVSEGSAVEPGDTLLTGIHPLDKADMDRLIAELEFQEALLELNSDDSLAIQRTDSLEKSLLLLQEDIHFEFVSSSKGLISNLYIDAGSELHPNDSIAEIIVRNDSSFVIDLPYGYFINRWPPVLDNLSLVSFDGNEAFYTGASDTGSIIFDDLWLIDRRALLEDDFINYVISLHADTVYVKRVATGSSGVIVFSTTPLDFPLRGWTMDFERQGEQND